MNSKNYRRNHDFQILHFLVGSCSTPDGAFSLLQDLKDERLMAIESYNVSLIRSRATRIKINKLLSSNNEEDVLEGQALAMELDDGSKRGEIMYQVTVDELNFIDQCMTQIEPYRKYRHLSISEANEATQHDEWLGELIKRAENFMLSSGSIPSDEFNTMRMHPAFKDKILPEINKIYGMLAVDGGATELQKRITDTNGMIISLMNVSALKE